MKYHPGLIAYWAMLITVWSANVTDLIRGPHFYNNTIAIIVWNVMGVIALVMIVTRR
jgi:hypothetical protein